jgi:large subunit ribosomal protein L5
MLKKYKEEIAPELMKKFNYKSVMQVPKLKKITVNVCTEEAILNSKVLQTVVKDLSRITNQKPVITKARKSISNFKLRKGMPIGAKVTLRNKNMYYFLDKLVSITFPSIKDFRGFSQKAFDKKGNYSLGLKEQTIFPEIEYDQVDKLRGMGIVFTTNSKTDQETMALLEGFGFPFRK